MTPDALQSLLTARDAEIAALRSRVAALEAGLLRAIVEAEAQEPDWDVVTEARSLLAPQPGSTP